jgi:hypothetical protein
LGCDGFYDQDLTKTRTSTIHPNENIVFGDNSRGDVLGLGKVAITLEHSITNVLHVDSLSYNLLSVS